jgi:putative transposase
VVRRQDSFALLIVKSLHRGAALGHYALGSFVVMPSHVHVLLLPHVPPSHILYSLKLHTAQEAGSLPGKAAAPYWQGKSYSHWVRNEREWARIVAYIEGNPVKVGLVARPQDYPWSSAYRACPLPELRLARTEVAACA